MRYAPLWIAGAIALMFVLQFLFGTERFLLDTAFMFERPWTIITAMFAHADIVHLLSNLFSLLLFGLLLEGRIGSQKVLWLFIASGILVNLAMPFTAYERVLGASGAVFALIGALLTLRPYMVIWLDFVPMPMIIAAILWIIQDILGVFYPAGVANIAHLAGLALGLSVGIYWRIQGFGDPLLRTRVHRGHRDAEIDAALDDYERDHGLR